MGAVGSARHIVYEDFIHESYTQKMFLPEENYVPAEISNIMEGNEKFGKQLFKDQKAVVLMENRRKQIGNKFFYILWKKNYSSLEVDKVMLFISYLASLDNKPRT